MAIVTLANGISQSAGVTYTHTTDSSSDWTSASLPNSAYFFDKATKLVYFKDSTGAVVNPFESGGDNISIADLTFDGAHTADINDHSWQLKDSTGINRLLLDVQQGNANGHGIGYGGAAIDGKHTFYNTNGSSTLALCNMSYLNGLKLSSGALENDYLNFGSAGFLLHIKSNVSYGSSIGVYPDITLRTRHSSFGVVLDTDNYVKFKKATVEHSLIDSSSRWILKGTAVIGSEKISLQDDTLIKGSNNSASTSGFKVTDINNNSLLDVKNSGRFATNGSNVNSAFNVAYDGTSTNAFTVGTGNIIQHALNAQSYTIRNTAGTQDLFKFNVQSGVSKLVLSTAANAEFFRISNDANCFLDANFTLGQSTPVTGARFLIRNYGTNVSQQSFFGNITMNTAGRVGSSGSFGTTQKGFECFDTDKNKKFFWNGSAWEQIVSGGATSGIGTKVLVQGRMDTTQAFTSTAERIDYVDNSTLGFDINGEWDNTTHRFTVAASGAGTYQFTNTLFVDNGSGWVQIFCKKNGVTQRITATDLHTSWDAPTGTTNLELAVGDYVEFWADSTSSFSVNATWYALNNFQITKIGDSVTVNNVVLPSLTKTIILESPADADYIPIFRTDVAITIQEALGALMAAGDVDIRLYWDTDLANSSPTAIGASTTLTTTTEAAVDISTDPTIPANSWIFLDIGTVATAATTVVNIRYTE